MHPFAQTRISGADPASTGVPGTLANPDEEYERLVQDFIDDISLDLEEMQLFVAMPELTIADARRLVAAARSRSE